MNKQTNKPGAELSAGNRKLSIVLFPRQQEKVSAAEKKIEESGLKAGQTSLAVRSLIDLNDPNDPRVAARLVAVAASIMADDGRRRASS